MSASDSSVWTSTLRPRGAVMPMLQCTDSTWPCTSNGRASTASTCSASSSASAMGDSLRSRTANSSPPSRATVVTVSGSPSSAVVARTVRSIRSATRRSSSSPTWCPRVSLTSLKWSMSTMSTARCWSAPGESRTRSTRRRNSSRLASPVSGSCSDCRSRRTARWVVRRTATTGTTSSGSSRTDTSTTSAASGPRATRTPEVSSLNLTSSRIIAPTRCPEARATTTATRESLTRANTAPATRAGSRSATWKCWYEPKYGSPLSRLKAPRASSRLIAYWPALKRTWIGRRPLRASSSPTATVWTSSSHDRGPRSTRATAKVVEIVTGEIVSSPRETGMGQTSPRARPTASATRGSG